MMVFSNKRRRDDEEGDSSSSHGKLPAVNTANMPEWKRNVTTQLAIINKTGITLPLYTPEPVIDAALEAVLRSAGYITGGAHAVMPIEEAILHHGTAKGKEVLKKRVDEREIWRLQNNQIFHYVQIACEGNAEIRERIKLLFDATALADRNRMDGRQLLDDICADFHQDTAASTNMRTSAMYCSKIKSGDTATDYCVSIEKEARSLLAAGVTLDVEQTCLQLVQQALSCHEKYRQFGISLFLGTGAAGAITWARVKEFIRAWDINHKVTLTNDRTTFQNGELRSNLRQNISSMERIRHKNRPHFRRNGQSFQPRRSEPPIKSSDNYYTANSSTNPASSSSSKPNASSSSYKKPFSQPRKFKYAKTKPTSIYGRQEIKCYKCGGPHMLSKCPQVRFGKSSANFLGSEKSSSGNCPNITAEGNSDDGAEINLFVDDFKDLPELADDNDDDEEKNEDENIIVDRTLFPSTISSSFDECNIDFEVQSVLSDDGESIDRSALFSLFCAKAESTIVSSSVTLKRKQSEASQDLFASDDDDDEVAYINSVCASRIDECYSPVAPSCSPTRAPFYFEETASPTKLPFDTSKLDSQSSELSTSYRFVISTDLDRIEDQVQLVYYDEFFRSISRDGR